MKFTAILFLTIFISCRKNDNTSCTPVTPESESAQIAAFCTSNGINYTIDTNYIYYQIIDQGSGISPLENSTITVTYTALTLDGKIIEDKSSTPVSASLSQFIEGWRIAIPYIQKGGRIKMVIPSSLAYGCTGVKNLIAPNSPLFYDVVLLDVQ